MQRLRYLIAITFLVLTSGFVLAQQPEPMGTPDTSFGFDLDVEEAASDVVGLSEEIALSTAGTVSNILEQILVSPQNQMARYVLIAGGILLMLAGWRIYEFVIIISGILIGATLGSAIFANSDPVMQVAGFVIGGFLGAVLSALLYYVAVFFIGAYVGVILAASIATTLGYEQVHPILLIFAALVGGVILLGLSFQLLIFLAALVGGQMLALGLGLGPAWTLLFTIVGVLIQIMMARQAGYDIRRPPRRRTWLLRRT